MTVLNEKAYAKINLTLDVLEKRADGYHDLQSVMQSISLCDDIQLELDTGKPWQIYCGREDVPADPSNLAWKAAVAFFDAINAQPDGLTIRVEKKIPSQAGLGGGSADAAAVLIALNRYFDAPFTKMQLSQLGAKVGSDVPFCVFRGTAMAEGRGERLRALPPMPDCSIVICKPDFSASTPELFRVLDRSVISKRPDNAAMEQALMDSDLQHIARCVYNVFEPIVAAEFPQVEQIKQTMISCGAIAAQMTGSGSAIFGIMTDDHAAHNAKKCLEELGCAVFVARPV